MKKNYNLSNKDDMCFTSNSTYNCPFCKRRNVKYGWLTYGCFDNSNSKSTYYYLARCLEPECRKISFHLSKYELVMHKQTNGGYVLPTPVKYKKNCKNGPAKEIKLTTKNFDDIFFYNEPTSSFIVDKRISRQIREPLKESYNCLKSGFLTGASACLRKAIYKLLKQENIPSKKENNNFVEHNERVELLKKKFPTVDSKLLDHLKDVHTLTSREVHENDWEDFNGNHLYFLLEIVKEVLNEMYIYPDEKDKRRKKLDELKKQRVG